jgi:hypothetical protein
MQFENQLQQTLLNPNMYSEREHLRALLMPPARFADPSRFFQLRFCSIAVALFCLHSAQEF